MTNKLKTSIVAIVALFAATFVFAARTNVLKDKLPSPTANNCKQASSVPTGCILPVTYDFNQNDCGPTGSALCCYTTKICPTDPTKVTVDQTVNRIP